MVCKKHVYVDEGEGSFDYGAKLSQIFQSLHMIDGESGISEERGWCFVFVGRGGAGDQSYI